jgi:hypothetical protein
MAGPERPAERIYSKYSAIVAHLNIPFPKPASHRRPLSLAGISTASDNRSLLRRLHLCSM